MNDPGETSGRPVSLRRRYAALYCLAMLHIAVLNIGLFAWPEMDYEQIAVWRFPLVLGGVTALVSLVATWLPLARLTLGRRLTIMFITLLSAWLVVTLLLRGVPVPDLRRVGAALVAIPVTGICILSGLIVFLASTRLRRRYDWVLASRGKIVRSRESKAERQFSVRHVMVWTLLAALVLGGLRATMPSDGGGADWSDLLEILAVFLGLGVIHAGVGLTTIVCVGLWPRLWTIMFAVTLTAICTAASAYWITLWGGANNHEWWGFSLPPVVHFVLLSASIALLRLAGYRFTRHVDMPTEAPTT